MGVPERFSGQLSRLKRALGVDEDREVAAALGMTATALALRKRRDAFPEQQVIELAAARPELNLDVVYIVTGAKAGGYAALLVREDETRLLAAELSAIRDDYVAKLRESADRMSLDSLGTLVKVAERIATADTHDNLTAPSFTAPSTPGRDRSDAASRKRPPPKPPRG